MALIKHHLIFQNVFAYNISNDNNVDFLKTLFILVSNSMYRYFIITLWFEFHIVLFYLINNLINRYFFFILLISFDENIICFGKQSCTQIHYFDNFSRVYLIILTKPMCSSISYIYLTTVLFCSVLESPPYMKGHRQI